MTEVAPKPFLADPKSLSGFLIPGGVSTTAGNPLQKHYLDLLAYPLNLASFFVNFSPSSSTYQSQAHGAGFVSGSDCSAIRMALPVPGFIFGFSKNPVVPTYYAVKGEANFVGLLYPFSDRNGVKLNAYAAAKPFGGRIGPKLLAEGRKIKILEQEINLLVLFLTLAE